jgi:uncharacterized protein YukE
MGNTGSIRVQYAGLDAASADIGTSAATLRGHVERMETALQPLGDILTRVGVAVRTARENYEEVERRNTRAWS